MTGPASRRVPLGFGACHLLEWPGAGPPVLLLHPNGMNARLFEPAARLLAGEHGLPNRLLAPDRRGHGLSAVPEPDGGWDVDAQLADTVELLDELGVDAVHAVGAMTGANLALLLASRHRGRVRSVVAVDPALALDPGVLAEVERMLAPERLRFASLEEGLARTADPAWDEETRAHWGRHFLRPAAGAPAGAVEHAFHAPGVLATERSLLRSLWDEIAVAAPALVVRGTGSWVLPAEEQARLVALIPGARAAEISGRLHPPLDEPAGLAGLVAEHVRATG